MPKSVITFCVPFTKETIESNIAGEESSREWDYAYIETNNLINDLSTYLYEKITAKGFQASLLPATYNYDAEKLISDWSHRSVAYISGMASLALIICSYEERVLWQVRECYNRYGVNPDDENG
ncbi:MAG: hypothetical protein ACOX2Q_09335 [Dehalobacterium sp.]